jgi:lauroyl/myristoyl acyltransferase
VTALWSRIRSRAAAAWLRCFFWLTAHAPWVLRVLGPVFLFFTWRSSTHIRSSTRANAAWLLGPDSTPRQRSRLGKAVTARCFEAVLDYGQNRRLSHQAIASRAGPIEGIEHYDQARRLRRGAILLTAHLGPFETAVANLREREPRIHVVFRRDPFPVLERLRSEQRARLGVIEAPIDDGLATWLRLRDALLADEVVLLQGDRAMPGQRSVRVPFLGGHLRLPTGPVTLAQATGAPIVPTFALVTPQGRVRIVVEEPIVLDPGHSSGSLMPDQVLTRFAAALAAHVRQYPDQWLVLEKAWCEDSEVAPT